MRRIIKIASCFLKMENGDVFFFRSMITLDFDVENVLCSIFSFVVLQASSE